MVATDKMVEPSVYTTEPSISPLFLSASGEASPAVGIANAINVPKITYLLIMSKPIDCKISRIAIIRTGVAISFIDAA